MDTMLAFVNGQANRNKELMVFDWDKAAKLIKESGAKCAEAGLEGDFDWTGGEIFTDGKPNKEDYTYLASTWATPQLVINGEYIECYKMQSDTPDWSSDTKWPDSALKLLS